MNKGLAKAMGIKTTEDYPDWYGIPGIKFIFINSWADPLIEYKGKRCSCFVVEDTMWDEFTHDDYGNYIERDENEFDGFMLENADEVRELCELALFGEEVA